METSVGKIINCDTSAELAFSLAPQEFHVDQTFDLRVEPALARSQPIVSFHGGGLKSLTTLLVFDRDADETVEVSKIQTFLTGLAKVSTETKSTPLVQFKLGNFAMKGYLNRLGVTYTRFATNGQPNQIRVDFSLVGAEEENGKA